MDPATPQRRAPMLVTVQIWNSVPTAPTVQYRDDWVQLTGALIETIAEDPEVGVRFAAEGTDWALVEGGVQTPNGDAELDPFDAKTFVVTAMVPAEGVARLEDRLEQLCAQHNVAPMWVATSEHMVVLSDVRPRRRAS